MRNSSEKATLVAKFAISGDLRFLSHQETMRMLRRALIRTGIKLWYSEGFNPHPKINLPLPRSVGVASNCEVLCAQIQNDDNVSDVNRVLDDFQQELPLGCRVYDLEVIPGNYKCYPQAVEYLIPVELQTPESHGIIGRVTAVSDALKKELPLVIERTDHKKHTVKDVQVNDYIEHVELIDEGILIKCLIKPTGTIRLEEIIDLFGCKDRVNGAIKRVSVQWASND